jgi:hypothetical protein
MLDSLESSKGGWTNVVLEFIGGKEIDPKVKGWKTRALGRWVDSEEYERILRERLHEGRKTPDERQQTLF